MSKAAPATQAVTVIWRLFRMPLALMNGAAALGGYLLFPAPPEALAVGAVFFGVALLAAAGSALNQVLERDLDLLMRRTSNRPLPKRQLAPAPAILVGMASLLAGASLLAAPGGKTPLFLGIATLFWYLMVYTPLKRRTPFALLLGALCGAGAPLIGWSVAGGGLADFRIVLLGGILYLWQVPHFWMLQRRHAEDYRLACLPLFEPSRCGNGLAPLCLLWMGAMIAGALLLPAFGLIGEHAPLWSAIFFIPLLLSSGKRLEPALFASVNLFPLVITLALCLGK